MVRLGGSGARERNGSLSRKGDSDTNRVEVRTGRELERENLQRDSKKEITARREGRIEVDRDEIDRGAEMRTDRLGIGKADIGAKKGTAPRGKIRIDGGETNGMKRMATMRIWETTEEGIEESIKEVDIEVDTTKAQEMTMVGMKETMEAGL